MKLLAVETSTAACSAAAWVDGLGSEVFEVAGNSHSDMLLPMIGSVLRQSGLTLHELDAIAFGEGPGSFTGLRVGVGVVQGLAFGAGLPVVPVSSLHAQAARCPAPRVLAAFDARMGQVYWCTFRPHEDGRRGPDGPPRVSEPGRIGLSAAGAWLATGTGCDRYREALRAANPDADLTFVENSFPHAMDVARLAERLGAGSTIPAERAVPRYVRNDVARL